MEQTHRSGLMGQNEGTAPGAKARTQEIGRKGKKSLRIFHDRQIQSKPGNTADMSEQTDTTGNDTWTQKQFNEMLDALDEGLVLYDSELNFVIGNRALDGIFYSEDVPSPQTGENVATTMQRLIDSDFYAIPDGVSEHDFLDQMIKTLRTYAKNATVTSRKGRVINTSVHKTALGGYLVSFSDITEQRKAQEELEFQRELAHQNEKLSALGELLACVAHELNNPLSIVVGYAQMVQGKLDDPVLDQRIARIAQAADRSAKIVKTFLAMARQKPARLETCSLNAILENALSIAGNGVRCAGAEIEVHMDETLPNVIADADQMAQVFTNLIVNAEHALEPMGDKGKLCLRTFHDTGSDEVVAEFRDNGAGIAPETQPRIFEPFFTTKDVGTGTGVGLAFSHRIVDAHGGRLTFESAPDQGTCFFVRLGATQKDIVKEIIPDAPLAGKGNYRILVIDDEEHVAELIRDMLEEAGHNVSLVTSGRQALRYTETENFDMILSDFKMPDLDGAAFYAALKSRKPELLSRLGFITGDTMGQKVMNFLKTANCPHIEKPIGPVELSALVEGLAGATGRARP